MVEIHKKNSYSHIRAIVTTLTFCIMVGGFFVANRVIKAPAISTSERRALATMPAFTWENVTSAKFMNDFEGFAADSFTGRDSLRTLRAGIVFDILLQSDKSGLYNDSAVGAGKFETVNADSVNMLAGKIVRLSERLNGLNLYYSFVPDKSIYANKQYPGFDAQEARDILGNVLTQSEGFTYIDLVSLLDAEAFYKTDIHWDQSKIHPVAAAMLAAMDAPYTDLWEIITLGDFEGVYRGQLALPLRQDGMKYLTRDFVSNLKVSYLDTKTGQMKDDTIYRPDLFAGRDPYDFFLGGAQALITIENPNVTGDRELYLFRDSFSSSLAPLFADSYSKITLIDLRYIDSRVLDMFVQFTPGSDVLFLYSSQIMNNATTLLTQ